MIKNSLCSLFIFFLLFGCTNKEIVPTKKSDSETRFEFLRKKREDPKRLSKKLRNLEIYIELYKFEYNDPKSARNVRIDKLINQTYKEINNLKNQQKNDLADNSKDYSSVIKFLNNTAKQYSKRKIGLLTITQNEYRTLLKELKLKPYTCILHKIKMKKEKIKYCGNNLYFNSNPDHILFEYYAKLRNSFPNSNEPATLLLINSHCQIINTGEVKRPDPINIMKYICPTCNKNRDKWFKEKGLPKESITAIK